MLSTDDTSKQGVKTINKDDMIKIRPRVKFNYVIIVIKILFGPKREKTCLRGFANNAGVDQPAQTSLRIRAV